MESGIHSLIVSTVLKGVPCLLAGLGRQVKAAAEQLKNSMQPTVPTEYTMDLDMTSEECPPYRFMRNQMMLVRNSPIRGLMVCFSTARGAPYHVLQGILSESTVSTSFVNANDPCLFDALCCFPCRCPGSSPGMSPPTAISSRWRLSGG